MEKYLFTDENTGVKQAQSKKELEELVQSSTKPEQVRIWIFNTQEWISYKDFIKSNGIKKENPAAGTARDDLLVGAYLLPVLRADHDEAGHTFLVAGLSDGGFALPHHAVIVGERALRHP